MVATDVRNILEHVFRYRVTTPEILAACTRMPANSVSEAQHVLNEMVAAGWLVSKPVSPSSANRFFHLTEQAAAELGHDATVAKEPSREMRIESLAIATFCCRSTPLRELFTKEEFKSKFSMIWYPGQPVRYYLEPSNHDQVRLAFLKVDKGGPSRWDRVIDSCRRFLKKRTALSEASPRFHPQVNAFNELVTSGKFQITLLTSLPEKCEAIRQALDVIETSGEQRPPIVPHAVDGLFDMIHPSTE